MSLNYSLYVVIFLIVFVILVESGRIQSPKRTFKAAVFEYNAVFPFPPPNSITREDAQLLMNINLDAYEKQARIAGEKGVDILLFPEFGLYGYGFSREGLAPYTETIPEPEEVDVNPWNPCVENKTEYSSKCGTYRHRLIQYRISCFARQNNIYIAANIPERRVCRSDDDATCPADGQYQYSTTVIFDPRGNFKTKYRKKHLYHEHGIGIPRPSEEVYFDTPFGRIGIFSGFDILFKIPAVDLIEKHKVDTVLYPTTWLEIDTLPLYPSIALQSAFARRMGVNVIAANLNVQYPMSYKCSGSGIYSPNGTAVYYRNMVREQSALVIATIEAYPKVLPPQPAIISIPDASKEKIFSLLVGIVSPDLYNFVELVGDEGTLTVCNGSLCCRVTYIIKNRGPGELYVLGAFDGIHKNSWLYIQTCTLLRCASNIFRSTCGSISHTDLTTGVFSHVHLTGTFSSIYTFPYVLVTDGAVIALPTDDWDFANSSIIAPRGFSQPVMAVTIFGRIYERDLPHPSSYEDSSSHGSREEDENDTFEDVSSSHSSREDESDTFADVSSSHSSREEDEHDAFEDVSSSHKSREEDEHDTFADVSTSHSSREDESDTFADVSSSHSSREDESDTFADVSSSHNSREDESDTFADVSSSHSSREEDESDTFADVSSSHSSREDESDTFADVSSSHNSREDESDTFADVSSSHSSREEDEHDAFEDVSSSHKSREDEKETFEDVSFSHSNREQDEDETFEWFSSSQSSREIDNNETFEDVSSSRSREQGKNEKFENVSSRQSSKKVDESEIAEKDDFSPSSEEEAENETLENYSSTQHSEDDEVSDSSNQAGKEGNDENEAAGYDSSYQTSEEEGENEAVESAISSRGSRRKEENDSSNQSHKTKVALKDTSTKENEREVSRYEIVEKGSFDESRKKKGRSMRIKHTSSHEEQEEHWSKILENVSSNQPRKAYVKKMRMKQTSGKERENE